ncbi:hypothetical protein E2C01_101379 [Portunus trituberculatus]|uniref:Uncharacterized protein n=1 Tax=Portunus trituberculatus TaxID=210409 RepID=A0A5B7KFY8_PORTR|nr:hypothetical protein [Portunus trituberculatus]
MASTLDSDSNSSNLSLKLRTGSSGSRDSFYLDLDRGIDSDIEELSGGRSRPVGCDHVSKVEDGVEVVEGVESGPEEITIDSSTQLQERKLLVQRLG